MQEAQEHAELAGLGPPFCWPDRLPAVRANLPIADKGGCLLPPKAWGPYFPGGVPALPLPSRQQSPPSHNNAILAYFNNSIFVKIINN